MKIRFYCDIPEYHYDGNAYWATSHMCSPVAQGYRRMAFDVDLPMKDLKAAEECEASAAAEESDK